MFAIEELRLRKLDEIVRIIQRVWRSKRGRAFYKKCIYTSVALFSGKKGWEQIYFSKINLLMFFFLERRAETVFRPFMGDYFPPKWKLQSVEILKKYGDKKVLFADRLQKVSPKLTIQNRRLIITDQAIYNLGGLLSKVTRRLMIKNATGLSLSTLQDDFFVIHFGSGDYDMAYASPKKTEIMCIIYEQFKELTNSTLQVNFTDS